jgi:cytoskeletal protein CcmA (bactofilin family)
MNKKRIIWLVLIPLILVSTIGFGLTVTAQAVEFDEDGIVEADEVIDDDLFIGQESIKIDGTINGDVFAGGNVVEVNGTINGSLISGAQVIRVNGVVSGSVYAGSSTLTLGPEAKIGRNFYYGGFNLSAEPGSFVSKDLLVGAYQAILSGQVGRDVRAAVGALEINGSVGNDVIAEVAGTGESQQSYFIFNQPGVETVIPSGIRVSEVAEIGGTLNYKSSEDQADTINITPQGGISYEYDPQMDPKSPKDHQPVGPAALVGAWFLKRLRVFITLLILGALIVWQLPELLEKVSNKLEKESLPALGWGMVTILVVYLGAFLVSGLIIAGAIFFGIVTLGELAWVILSIGFSSLGLVLAGFGLLVSYGSKLVVAYLVGRLLLKWLAPKFEGSAFWPLSIGILLYTFLRAIPLGFGFVISVVVTLVGLGAMWLYYRDRMITESVES